MKISIFILLSLSLWLYRSIAYTAADDGELLSRGDARVLLGALIGDVSAFRQGVSEGGEPNALLTPLLGEKVLKIGRPIIDFPIMPALHLCMHFGAREYLNTAFDMINRGADPNAYRIPESPHDYGFAPALLYTLGMGLPPNMQHGAVLQRIYENDPKKFNMTAIQDWIIKTGNPPLSHIPALHGFSDGVYILLSTFGWNVNEQDSHGLTLLHVAAWRGDTLMIALLLSHNADMLIADKNGRLPLHYAAMRGFGDIIDLLFIPPLIKGDDDDEEMKEMSPKKFSKIKRAMINAQDKDRRTPLMLAALTPSVPTSVRGIRQQMTKEKIYPPKRWNRAPLKAKRDQSPNAEPDDAAGTLGGWPAFQESGAPISTDESENEERVDVDILLAKTASKGVFKRDYFSTQRPVLFSGHLMAGQPIWAYWSKLDLVQRYGDLLLHSGESVHAQPGAPDLPMSEKTTLRLWVEQNIGDPTCMSGASSDGSEAGSCPAVTTSSVWSAVNYEASSQPVTNGMPVGKTLMADVQRPKIMDLCGPNDKENLKFSIGAVGSGVPIHAHNASWNVLLFGKKRWFLVPPGVNASEPGLLTKAPATEWDFSVQSVSAWLSEHAPSLRSRGLLSEITQYPGEIIFIPHGWHHATLNLAVSASISQEFCTLRNSDIRIQSLGPVIYGSNDSFRGFGRIKYHYHKLHKARLDDHKRSNVPSFGAP